MVAAAGCDGAAAACFDGEMAGRAAATGWFFSGEAGADFSAPAAGRSGAGFCYLSTGGEVGALAASLSFSSFAAAGFSSTFAVFV